MGVVGASGIGRRVIDLLGPLDLHVLLLYALPKVLLTPHIAGSLGDELGRIADWATDEVVRYAQGLPFA